MTKMRVLKEGGFSGKKHAVGDVVDVKSTLAPILQQDGRAEIIDESGAPTKQRASARGGGRGARGRRAT